MTDDKKVSYIFEALDKSGVKMIDFHRLTNISRNTLYMWKSGRNIRDGLRLNLAYSTAIRLEVACRNGNLPLPDKLKLDQRVELLRSIVRKSSPKKAA